MTKIDVLSGHETLKICTAYEIDGEIYNAPPASIEKLIKAKPIYEELPGWTEDISKITNYDELPENCKKYIKRVEELIKAPISMVSVGPDRVQNIFINEI